jgi:alcohol dehydrogenase
MYEQGLAQPFEESQPFRIEEVELAPPGPDEVLVDVRAAGICHSDLSQVKGLRKRQLPVVGGHEAAGIVREIGPGVTRVKVGDHVVMTGVSGCGECEICRDGYPALCKSVTLPRTKGLLASGETRLSRGGETLYHYSGISGFAQYAVVMENNLVAIDKSVPLDVAAMFGCAVVTGAGAVFNTARLDAGRRVAVIGLGGVGLNAVMAARIAGASQIIGIDTMPEKFELAKELGATHVFLANEPDLVARIRELSEGGLHYVFDMTGAPPALKTAYDVLRPHGEIISVGLGATGAQNSYDHTALVSEEKSIRGCFMGSCQPDRDIPKYVEHFSAGQMPIDRLRTETITLEDINRGFDRLARGEVIRQIVLPHGTL